MPERVRIARHFEHMPPFFLLCGCLRVSLAGCLIRLAAPCIIIAATRDAADYGVLPIIDASGRVTHYADEYLRHYAESIDTLIFFFIRRHYC